MTSGVSEKCHAMRVGGKRGAGIPGYGVLGYGVRGPGVWKTRSLVENVGPGGKRGVWWKTRGLENAGSGGKRGVPFFSPKYEFSSVK